MEKEEEEEDKIVEGGRGVICGAVKPQTMPPSSGSAMRLPQITEAFTKFVKNPYVWTLHSVSGGGEVN